MMQTQKSTSKVIVEFNDGRGRGFEPIGVDLPDSFLQQDKKTVLITIALLFAPPDPRCGNRFVQAVYSLALYASGAMVMLTKQQFRQLERRVKDYMSIMRAPVPGYEHNAVLAAYVRRHAVRQAKREGII